MQQRRVVVTGMGVVSPLGRGVGPLYEALLRGESGIRALSETERIQGLSAGLAGRVDCIDPAEVPRRLRRTMSPMSIYALAAAQDALHEAGMDAQTARALGLGVCMGSTLGSPAGMEDFFRSYLPEKSMEQVGSTIFFKIMGHSAAANVAQALDLHGGILAPSGACASGLMAVGLGWERIACGHKEALLCGGADEFHPLTAATFDILGAHSQTLDPNHAPRPFAADRDGVVCAEGAGVLLLESYESAKARNVPMLAEIIGFADTSDPSSPADPSPEGLPPCSREVTAPGGRVEPITDLKS